jgi:hypothetical protein
VLHLSRDPRAVTDLRLFVRAVGDTQMLAVELSVRVAGGAFVVVVPVPASQPDAVRFTSFARHPRMFNTLCDSVAPNLGGRLHPDNVFEHVAGRVLWQTVEPSLLGVTMDASSLARFGVPAATVAALADAHTGWAFAALAVPARQWGPDVVHITPFQVNFPRADDRLHVPGIARAPSARRVVVVQARLPFHAGAMWVGSAKPVGVVGPPGFVDPARPVAIALEAAGEDAWLTERASPRPRPWSLRAARAAVEAAAQEEAARALAEAAGLAAPGVDELELDMDDDAADDGDEVTTPVDDPENTESM